MKHRVIYEQNNYRIIEVPDHYADLDDLKGDCFDPKVNPEIDAETLKEEETRFEALVQREGVFGYVLERWDPSVNAGWTYEESCFGFVGQYTKGDSIFDHYIVDDLINQIPETKETI